MIIDTNVLIQFYFSDDESKLIPYLRHSYHAPAFIKIELLNVLRKAHFLNQIKIEKIDEIYNSAISLIEEFHDNDAILDLARSISFKLNHPIYDCLFLSLSLKLDLPFLSSDTRLLIKAQSIGIETIHF
jgi:predicted nucleic acid-binding protein